MRTPTRSCAPWRILAGLALLTSVALAGCSSSSGKPHVDGGYLALGDSLAFGYQPATVTTPSAYADATNFVGYPALIAKDRHLAVTNTSCPGETTASMIHTGSQDNGCNATAGTSADGYRDKYPLHAKYSGSQLDYAVGFLGSHPKTRLVTLDIGGNDLFLCYRMTPSHCSGSAATDQLRKTSQNLTTILTTLRKKTGYQGTIVLVTYYANSYASAALSVPYQALNSALTTVAARFDVVVADGYRSFDQASDAFGGDPCKASLLTVQPSGSCDYHPSAQGQQLVAKTVEKVLPNTS